MIGIKLTPIEQHPVAVVSIVGPYHTGKSFLLNQVARSLPHTRAANGAEEEEGAMTKKDKEEQAEEVFVVGRGVDPETSGAVHAGVFPKKRKAGSVDCNRGTSYSSLLFLPP